MKAQKLSLTKLQVCRLSTDSLGVLKGGGTQGPGCVDKTDPGTPGCPLIPATIKPPCP